MSARPDRHNFLNWKLAFTWECPVDAQVSRETRLLKKLTESDRPFREWVTLEDGKQVQANFGTGTVTLRFNRHSDRREVRAWLRSAPEPFLTRLELTSTDDGRLTGRLAMMRTALPSRLEQAPSILVEDGVVEDLTLKDLVKLCGVRADEGHIVCLVQTPIQLRTQDQVPRNEVKIFLHRGGILTCRIEGVGDDQYLRATAFERGDRRSKELQDVRFIHCPQPRFVTTPDEIEGTPLEVLAPVTNDHLRAWMDYEHAERRGKEALLERRRNYPLEYSEVVGKPGSSKRGTLYPVALVNAEDGLDQWVAEGQRREGDAWRVEASLSVHDLGDTNGSEVEGVLTKIRKEQSGRVVGVLELESSITPPARGKLVAKEHWGDRIQHSRRDNAVEKLRCGRAANPDLLRYLLYPESIPPIESQDRTYWRRPDALALNERQRRAVVRAAKEPAVLLIQGPPGTGKTTVIAEIIHQLRNRYRNVDAGDERGPLRVLVSSIQNDAVDNAAEKLSNQEVFVDLFASPGDDDASHQIATDLRSRRVAAGLYKELRENPGFARYERLCSLRKLISGLSPHLSIPDAATLAHIDDLMSSASAQAEMTDGLTSELSRLRDELDELLSELEESEAAGEATDTTTGMAADLRGAIQAIADETQPLSPTNLESRLAMLETVTGLLEHVEPTQRTGLEKLRAAALGVRRLRRAAKRGEVDQRASDTWNEIVQACTLPLGSADEPSTHEPESPLTRWERGARDWLARMKEHLEEAFDQHSASEAAVRYDWVRALNERPMTMPEVIRSYAPVTATTCQKADRFDDTVYDVVIVDEAGRGGLDVLIPMTMGRSVILIGDQNQLPPHVEDALEKELEEELRREVDLSTTSLFSFLWDRLGGTQSTNCVALNHQFRMHRDIGTLVSRSFYEPEVKLRHACKGGPDASRAPTFGLFDDEPFVWVDTSDHLQTGDAAGWPFDEENPWEADLIVKILSQLDEDTLEALADRTKTRRPVGLVPFYTAQKKLLEQKLRRSLPRVREYVELGTADSFQGKQFPLVLLSTVRSNADGRVGFLALPNRLNVGISRAQSQVILLADSSCLAHSERGSAPFKSVWADVNDPDQPGLVIPSRQI